MTSQPIQYEERENALNQLQGELLEALLQADEDCYPWNPADPDSEAYFATLEREFLLEPCQDDGEIASKSQRLFDQLHQCWTSLVSSATETFKPSFPEQFAHVPQIWLEAITNQAQQVFRTNLSLAEQLVLCVKPLLPNWAEDDLLTLARPWAYAMRSNLEPVSIRAVEWTELSPMEQARLSLALAHSALVQLQDSTGGS
ncbi:MULTISPECIES: hypothetical protein [unclassified Coleofasciculus]|uniref:hypothetical protein n=1 Tax=unclassified Coleofasciculus TaxID=2692782 RepID=UPI0018821B9F|nr:MULTISPECIES: hypothetical protein [unclassified Coleofasciculus]MBE9129210.1 hypothetical protein [Coleofasciculus sp. LEGE 07081]MBE9149714.1 hypothetical protein [Coleofasciculus sp. LEGE 07092]